MRSDRIGVMNREPDTQLHDLLTPWHTRLRRKGEGDGAAGQRGGVSGFPPQILSDFGLTIKRSVRRVSYVGFMPADSPGQRNGQEWCRQGLMNFDRQFSKGCRERPLWRSGAPAESSGGRSLQPHRFWTSKLIEKDNRSMTPQLTGPILIGKKESRDLASPRLGS